MIVVTEDIVNEILNDLSESDYERARSEINSIYNIQPYFLSFVKEFTQELNKEAAGVSLFCFVCIFRMFQKRAGKPLGQVSLKTIEETFIKNEEFVDKLEYTHEKFLDRIAETHLSHQPYVLKYIIETIFESFEEDDVNEEESGLIFLILKTVVDILHDIINEE